MSRLIAFRSEQIPAVWPRVEGHIKRALDRGSNYTIDDVLQGLCAKEMQLWASFSNEIEAALVTAIQTDKKNTFCLLLALGGENMAEWGQWLPEIEKWARDNGAQEMRIYGRRGWAKAFGFDIEYTKMSKILETGQ